MAEFVERVQICGCVLRRIAAFFVGYLEIRTYTIKVKVTPLQAQRRLEV